MTLIATAAMVEMVEAVKRRAELGAFNGIQTASAFRYLERCTIDHDSGVRILFTRDVGHHTSGWFKNPDYERCYHLSMSFWEPFRLIKGKSPIETGNPRDPEKGEVEFWVDLFYGPWKRYVWEESPKSKEGKAAGVHHYRVFCDPRWQPLLPRGEVYSTEFTEKGWKSWSELHDYPLNPEAAGTHTSG